MNFEHIPVLLNETMEYLAPERGGIFVDATLGGGGHSSVILSKLDSDSRLFGIDRDKEALTAAGKRLKEYPNFQAIHGNFFDMASLLSEYGILHADGILMDLGVSSYQLDNPDRGFSFKHEAALDMRMDQTSGMTAADIVNTYTFEELCRIFRNYGEERYADRISDAILKERKVSPIQTTTQLSDLICKAMPSKSRNEQQHPARRCFQALRIEVNHELDGLEKAIRSAHNLLNKNGRLVIITFHSLEDRIVKNVFKSFENPCTCPPKAPICICGKKPTAKILTNKPVVSSEKELEENPRCSCAKLRAIKKIV